jgi:uncharacterized protein with NRDE domain
MCFIGLFFHARSDTSIVACANREEAYARGGEPPGIISQRNCHVIAGRDPIAGGTWLGINEHGLLVAVTNRSKKQIPTNPRSRGLLALDLLDCPNTRVAAACGTAELSRHIYGGCNLLLADYQAACVIHGGDLLQVQPLSPGLHLLAAGDIDDQRDPRLSFARDWLRDRDNSSLDRLLADLQLLCAIRGTNSPAMCIHGPSSGTVSSTIVALRPSLSASIYLHAQGPPDVTPFADYSFLLKELAAPAAK